MGTLLSRSSCDITNNGVDSSRSSLYRYPPTNGTYFSNQYYLGHRRFETGEPEVFLFGDLHDINYLHSKPIKFPYKQPPKSQPLNTLRSYINVQRDSIKLVKQSDCKNDYHLQFVFDSDLPCKFTIFTSLPDSVSVESLTSREADGYSYNGKAVSYSYGAGSEQVFNQEDEVIIHPGELTGEGKGYDPINGMYTVPLALLMETDDGQQGLLSYCTIDSFGEDNYSIKIIKQKLLADGMEILLQEIYGLENKLKPSEKGEADDVGSSPDHVDSDDDDDDDCGEDLGTECVICITDVRDTLLLPCRHFCLCSSCAANLRYQSSNCPICRAPFRALLHIKALEPLPCDVTLLDEDEVTGNPKYSFPGYQHVPLLQALNGYHFKDDNDHQSNSPASPATSAEATTEFCVVPIEDELTPAVTSDPIETPTRTMVKPSGEATTINGVIEQLCGDDDGGVLLPGTPDTRSDVTSPRLPQQPLALALEEDEEDSGGGGGGDGSISSGVSGKSTDVLLAAAERN